MAAQSQKYVGDKQTGLRSRVLSVRCWVHSDVQSGHKKVQGQKPLICIFASLLSSDTGRYFVGAPVKLRKASVSLVTSVLPDGTTRHPVDGLSYDFTFENFSTMCGEHSSIFKFRQE